MKFAEPLIKGEIKANYRNIILDVLLNDGSIVPVFCYEPDKHGTLYVEGEEVWLSREYNEKRSLKYETQIVKNSGSLVFANPNYTEHLFMEAIKNNLIEEMHEYVNIRKITKHDALKYIQFELTKANGDIDYIYTAYVYRKEGGCVVFPSSINIVEDKVLLELQSLRAKGHNTIMFLVAARQDVWEAKFTWSLDQIAAAKIFEEAKNGLKFLCYGCKVTPESVEIERKINIVY